MAMTNITASEAAIRRQQAKAQANLAPPGSLNTAGLNAQNNALNQYVSSGVAGLQDHYAMAEYIRIYQQHEAKKMMDQRMGSTVLHHTEIRRIENGFLVYIAVKENEASKIFYAESVEEASKVLVGELVKREILED